MCRPFSGVTTTGQDCFSSVTISAGSLLSMKSICLLLHYWLSLLSPLHLLAVRLLLALIYIWLWAQVHLHLLLVISSSWMQVIWTSTGRMLWLPGDSICLWSDLTHNLSNGLVTSRRSQCGYLRCRFFLRL